jgi:hypothetical protein
MIDDAYIMNEATVPFFSRQTYLERSETSATMGRRASVRLEQPSEYSVLLVQSAMSTEIGHVHFYYADPEDGGSKLLRIVSNYLPTGLHTS